MQATAEGGSAEEAFHKAQAELDSFIDTKAHQWSDFFDLIDGQPGQQQTQESSELRFWVLSQALKRIIVKHLRQMPAET